MEESCQDKRVLPGADTDRQKGTGTDIMTKREELEQKLSRLRWKQEELEEQLRRSIREVEEQDDELMYAYRDLENQWEDYGRQDAAFTALLEEEREQVSRLRERKFWIDEELRDDFRRKQNQLEEEYYTMKRLLYRLEEEAEEEDV